MTRSLRAVALLLGTACAAPAWAHSFGKTYNLPIPFWMYLYGAAAALVLSFLVIGYTVGAPAAERSEGRLLPRLKSGPHVAALLKGLGLAALALCIVAGLVGTQLAYFNINMTLFWVVFVLGGTYLTALLGNWYALANPWKTLSAWGLRLPLGFRPEGRLPYPPGLAWYPALLFYLGFIALELYSNMTPRLLSEALLAYTALNLLGAWLLGAGTWFRHCEFFGVYFELIARLAPVEAVVIEGQHRLRLRPPFLGLLRQPATHPSQLLFILFMLSSTAYDGLHETAPWVRGFWVHLYGALTPLLGGNIVETYPVFSRLYALYQLLGLLLSPLLYLLIDLAFLAMMKRLAGSALPLRELALRFACSLIPIALVYNLSHYLSLFVTQGTQMLRLVSDPFGYGWDLFGTAHWLQQPVLPGMGLVWHAQVGLILAGHILSVYLAHLEALRLFPSRRRTMLSQAPMLLLMVAYTTMGLWVLAQPITAPPNPG